MAFSTFFMTWELRRLRMVYTAVMKESKIVCRDEIENVEFTVPVENYRGFAAVKEPPPITWEKSLSQAFNKPMGCSPLRELAKHADNIAIIVSDSTRGVPTAHILPFVLEELSIAGVNRDRIVVVIATGAHRAATDSEIQEIIGEDLVGKIKVINHDAFQMNNNIYIGTTSSGTPVEINKTVLSCDFRISIGKVEPHEFAGFSGGRKSVLPGVSSEKTIKINHRPEMMLAQGSRIGVLDGNPISDDMLQAAEMLGVDFTVNVVLDSAGQTVGIFTGDLVDCHRKAVDYMRSFCQMDINDKPDIIVTTPGKPLNINLYQAVKPLFVLEDLLSPGGVMILYCSCPDGLGAPDLLLPYEGAETPDEVILRLKEHFEIQMDQALYLCRILQKGIHIIIYSPNVAPELIRKMFMLPADSLQNALNTAYSLTTTNEKRYPKVMYFPQAQRALPRLEN
jgi:nickel-dependent lactate racemase